MDERQYNMDERQITYPFLSLNPYQLHTLTTYIQLPDLTTLQPLNCPTTQPHQAIARTHNQNPKPKTEPPYPAFARFPLRSATPCIIALPPRPLSVKVFSFLSVSGGKGFRGKLSFEPSGFGK